MARFLANLVIAGFAVAVVFALFPTETTAKYAARVANRIVGCILDGTYRVVDAVAGHRERSRAARQTPAPQEGNASEQHRTDAQASP